MGVLVLSYSFFDMAALTLSFINSENSIFDVQNRHGRLTWALPLLWEGYHLLHPLYLLLFLSCHSQTMDVSVSATGKPFDSP